MATETMEKVKRGDMGRDEQRALAASTFETSVDAQGRISIDRTLREFAGLELGTRVMVSGSFDRVEIWNPQAYDDVVARGGAALKGA
jgi:DNA-binding transcriptional regulator/RsmH inhibitor MraZ